MNQFNYYQDKLDTLMSAWPASWNGIVHSIRYDVKQLKKLSATQPETATQRMRRMYGSVA